MISFPIQYFGNNFKIRIFAPYFLRTKYYMKYNELEKRIKKNGCYDTGEQQAGHPLWYCPKTDMYFQMSNHGKEEVAKGTLNAILRAAGLK